MSFTDIIMDLIEWVPATATVYLSELIVDYFYSFYYKVDYINDAHHNA